MASISIYTVILYVFMMELRRIILDKSELLFKLLLYVREKQDNNPGVSKQNLVDYLLLEELSSRMTTFGIIDQLVNEKILLDHKNMNHKSNLRINPDYDFDSLFSNVLRLHYEESQLKATKLKQMIERWRLLPSITEDKEPKNMKIRNQYLEVHNRPEFSELLRNMSEEFRNYPELKEDKQLHKLFEDLELIQQHSYADVNTQHEKKQHMEKKTKIIQ